MKEQLLAGSMKLLAVLMFGLASGYALGQAAEPARAGQIDFAVGAATITPLSGSRMEAREGSIIRSGDTVETAPGAEVHIKMEDGGYLAVRPSSVLQITSYVGKGDKDDALAMSLLKGAFRSVTGWIGKINRRNYRIAISTATIGIRGTDHEIVHIPADGAAPDEIPGTHDRVNRGATYLEKDGRILEIPEGKAGYAGLNEKLELHEKIPGFLERRRTSNEERVERYSREIERHIEEKLRAAGHIKERESAREFFRRHEERSSNRTRTREREFRRLER